MTTATMQNEARQRPASFPTARYGQGRASDEYDGLGILKECFDLDLLTPEQEQMLAMRVQAGDWQARTHFITANIRLVMSIARRYVGSGIELPDLVQEGVIGLIRAVDKFDPSQGGRFSTYAHWWIHQTISRAVEEKGPIHLPRYAHTELRKIRRCRKSYIQTLGREPRIEEIT